MLSLLAIPVGLEASAITLPAMSAPATEVVVIHASSGLDDSSPLAETISITKIAPVSDDSPVFSNGLSATHRVKLTADTSTEPLSSLEPALLAEADTTLSAENSTYSEYSDSGEAAAAANPAVGETALTATDLPETAATAIPEDDSASVETEALYETVFGQSRSQRAQRLPIPVLLNDEEQGSLVIEFSERADAAQPAVDGQALLDLLQNSLEDSAQTQLVAALDDSGRLTLPTLREAGLAVEFDRQRLELNIQIPPELRKRQVNAVGGNNVPAYASTARAPSSLSGYLNLRGSQSFAWAGETSALGRGPLQMSLEGVLNWQGWVLEGGANFTEDSGTPWQRSSLRLVHDEPEQAVRYTLGEITSPTQGYQRGLPMLGIALTRNFSLQPFRRTTPINQYEFFLERPSRVQVMVNDKPVTTLRLEAGPQDIRDLPLTRGINDIQLIVTDDLGVVSYLDFTDGVAGGLLAPGTQQFAYSLGVKKASGGAGYDFSQPVLSLSHQVGLSNSLTIGGYFQGDFSRQLLGITGTWATSLGNFGWDAAVSRDPVYGIDVAGKLIYELLIQGVSSEQQRSLQLALEYRGANFLTMADQTPNNPTGFDISLAYRQRLFSQIQASFNARYQFGRGSTGDAYSFNLGLSRPISRHLTVNLGLGYDVAASGQTNQRLSLGLSMSLPQQNQTLFSQSALSSNSQPTSQLTWNFNPSVVRGGIGASLTASQSANADDLESQLRYQGSRADIGLRHRLSLPHDGQSPMEMVSTLDWGTALAFADGHFGWSRPIDNSFVLLTRRGIAQGQEIRVNPGLQGPIAQANGLGAAVVAVQPYQLSTLTVDAPHLPVGYDLGDTNYTVLASYRSGTLIPVGTEATVFLRGALRDAADQAVSLQQGQIKSLTDPDWPAVDLFTNRTGRFALVGFKPGRYQLRLLADPAAVMEFTIDETIAGQYDIGTLQIPVALPQS